MVPDTNGLFLAVDVVADDARMLLGPRRDCDFDLRILRRKLGQVGFEESS